MEARYACLYFLVLYKSRIFWIVLMGNFLFMAEYGATNLLVQRNANLKSRTLSNNTFDKNLRAMRFCNPPRDRETKPSSGLPGACFVRPIEPLKNNGQIFLR